MIKFDRFTFFTFTGFFQSHVEWIFPAFFNWRPLYASWWFSWYILSNMKNLPQNLSWHRCSDIFRWFFLLTTTPRLSFLNLNFAITDSFLLKRRQACKWSGITSCLGKEITLQMFSLSSSSMIDWVAGFTSTDSRRWSWALVTAFFSNWTILSVNNLFQFLVLAKSDETFSNLHKKSLNWFDKPESFDDMHWQWWVPQSVFFLWKLV